MPTSRHAANLEPSEMERPITRLIMYAGLRAPIKIPRGRAGPSCEARKARGAWRTRRRVREQRATWRADADRPSPLSANWLRRPGPRLALLLLSVVLRLRRRRLALAARPGRAQRGSRGIVIGALSLLLSGAGTHVPSAAQRFRDVHPGMTRAQVVEVLGEPSSTQKTIISNTPVFGLVEQLTARLTAGSSYEEWVHHTKTTTYYVWFGDRASRAETAWTVIDTASVPLGVVC